MTEELSITLDLAALIIAALGIFYLKRKVSQLKNLIYYQSGWKQQLQRPSIRAMPAEEQEPAEQSPIIEETKIEIPQPRSRGRPAKQEPMLETMEKVKVLNLLKQLVDDIEKM